MGRRAGVVVVVVVVLVVAVGFEEEEDKVEEDEEFEEVGCWTIAAAWLCPFVFLLPSLGKGRAARTASRASASR